MNSIGCGFNVYVYWLKTCKCTVCVCLCVTIHCSFSPHKTRKNMHTQILCALCKWQQKQNERGIRSLDFGCCSVRKGVDQKTSVLLQISREQNIICLWFVCYAILAGWLVVWQVTMHLFWSLSLLSIEFTLSIKRFFIQKFESVDWFFFLIWVLRFDRKRNSRRMWLLPIWIWNICIHKQRRRNIHPNDSNIKFKWTK